MIRLQFSILAAALAIGAGAACRPLASAERTTLPRDDVLGPDVLASALEHSPLPAPRPDPTNRFGDDPRAAELGRRVFFDPRFSADGTRSCASCHDPAQGWADGRALAEGVVPLDRHAMTLWNVAYNRWFFWDGRADTAWGQALEVFENPLELASTRVDVARTIAADPKLAQLYSDVFGSLPDLADEERFPAGARPVPEEHMQLAERWAAGDGTAGAAHEHAGGDSHFYHPHQRAWDGMQPADREAVTRVFVNVGKALAAFERQIVSRDSAFDRYVAALRAGDEERMRAYPAAARRGLGLFLGRANCHVCHRGPEFTDREFHNIGVVPAPDGRVDDPGRNDGILRLREQEFRGTGPYSDDTTGASALKLDYLPTHVHGTAEFKTPSLRNVARTAPYMHQGQFATLHDVLRHYSRLEPLDPRNPLSERVLQPLELTEAEIDDLVRFLETLTDESVNSELDASQARAR